MAPKRFVASAAGLLAMATVAYLAASPDAKALDEVSSLRGGGTKLSALGKPDSWRRLESNEFQLLEDCKDLPEDTDDDQNCQVIVGSIDGEESDMVMFMAQLFSRMDEPDILQSYGFVTDSEGLDTYVLVTIADNEYRIIETKASPPENTEDNEGGEVGKVLVAKRTKYGVYNYFY